MTRPSRHDQDTDAWADETDQVHGRTNGQVLTAPEGTDESYWAALMASDQPDTATATPKPAAAAIDTRYLVLDWHAAFANQPDAIPWLVEPLFERGRSYALFAPAKEGKSLVLQDVAAALATGRSALGNPPAPPAVVMYLDEENAVSDIVERMSAYGYEPGDLGNLRYLSFPSLPPLDTLAGGTAVLELAQHHKTDIVVIDTATRFISGGENDSDTFHALYRHTIAPLKAAGIAVVRLDHAGKDPARGQRGSSAKSTDVDVVWRLERDGPNGITLHRDAARNTHHPERIHLVRRLEPLRHELADGPTLAIGTLDTIALLNELQIPATAGRDRCRKALTDAHHKVSNATLEAAIRARKTCPGQVDES